jgi:CubicO group peptidase (beta-lactamase class C family)
MTRTLRFAHALLAVLVAVTFGPYAAAPQARQQRVAVAEPPLSSASPERVGFSSEALKELDAAMRGIVDKQHLAGVVTMLARHGQVVHQSAYGARDIATRAPMQLDTIARIYSMTKPIAGVAMMMLYEEGKWQPGDPIAKHIPQFANLKVYAGTDANGQPILEAPAHAPTMGELMSHTAGFTYGPFGNTPVDKLYQAANPLAAPSLQAFIDIMATLPLAYQPGQKWMYSVSVDIQGYLVEKLSGQSFPEFLQRRLFEPLGMTDTAFLVPAAKLPRVATIYAWDQAKGALAAQPHDPGISKMPGLPSGGGGLYSTAGDYLRFAQMLAGGGEFNGRRYLKASSVTMMRTNVLSEQVLNSKSGIASVQFRPGFGFGYDFAVEMDPPAIKSPLGKGSYWWWGIAGTWFWIDPANDLAFVAIIQRRGGVPGAADHQALSRALVYKALTDPGR